VQKKLENAEQRAGPDMDINPIEHMWALLKRKMKQEYPDMSSSSRKTSWMLLNSPDVFGVAARWSIDC
jgi:hypothetical protein